jgi:molybdopterin-dependent oxidoreductase alpha subunit
MRNELGHWPEVCKKSLQAMAADMQGALEPRFFQQFSLKQLQAMSPRELETAGRLVQPLLADAGKSHYAPLAWEDAMATFAAALKAADPQETFFYFSGRSSNEAGFLLALLARLYGTNHVNNCSYYCHQASGVALSQVLGTGTATIDLEDVEHADLMFLIGANPASNHPRLMTQLMKLRRRGGKVIAVNPVKELGLRRFRVPSDPRSLLFGSDIASHWAQIHVGGDIALLAGMAKALRAIPGAVDHAFIAKATDDFGGVEAQLDALSWDEVELKSGMRRPEIEELARVYAQSKRAVFGWTMGITHHEHGVQNNQWIVNQALMRRMIGKPSAGL